MGTKDSSLDIILSVIVPTYNYADRLSTCLGSVLTQLPPNVELIVIDDGSTDQTEAVVNNLRNDGHNDFIYVRQANRGAASARNHGLQISRGKYVLFLDADDELMPETIRTVCAYLTEHPKIGLLMGGHISHYSNGKEKPSRPSLPPTDVYARISSYLLSKRISLGHGSFVALKQLLERRPYPEHLRKREDIPVFAYLLVHARIACIDHLMVKVNKHLASLRHRDFGAQENLPGLVEEIFQPLPDTFLPLRRSYTARRYQSLLQNSIARKDWHEAKIFLVESLQLDWRQALNPSSIRKALRALLFARKQRGQ
jgi:hypothetical protein